MIQVKFRKLHIDAKAPVKGSEHAAGYDLTATTVNDVNGFLIVSCGLAFEIPQGYAGYLFPRSGIANKDLILSNCVGVIDSDYRGEVLAKFRTTSQREGFPNNYKVNERFAQLIIMPVPEVEYTEANELSDTARGAGGYGSTGS